MFGRICLKKFEKIWRSIHFNNNSTYKQEDPEWDRSHKIQSLYDSIFKSFQTVPVEELLGIDEQICPTKKKKLFKAISAIKTKKVGLQISCFFWNEWLQYNLELYTGKKEKIYTNTTSSNVGVAGNTVIRLCNCIHSEHHKLYFDDYYSSLP